jgi:hypothetical protein
VDPLPRGPDWMQITPKAGSLFHAIAHLDRQKHFLAVAAHAQRHAQRDRGCLFVKTHAHGRAIKNKADDRLFGERAGVAGVPVALGLAPNPADGVLAHCAAEQRRGHGAPGACWSRTDKRRQSEHLPASCAAGRLGWPHSATRPSCPQGSSAVPGAHQSSPPRRFPSDHAPDGHGASRQPLSANCRRPPPRPFIPIASQCGGKLGFEKPLDEDPNARAHPIFQGINPRDQTKGSNQSSKRKCPPSEEPISDFVLSIVIVLSIVMA